MNFSVEIEFVPCPNCGLHGEFYIILTEGGNEYFLMGANPTTGYDTALHSLHQLALDGWLDTERLHAEAMKAEEALFDIGLTKLLNQGQIGPTVFVVWMEPELNPHVIDITP